MKYICVALLLAVFVCGCAGTADSAPAGNGAAAGDNSMRETAEAFSDSDMSPGLHDAVMRNPNDAGAYYKRGSAYHGRNDYDKAIADYSEVIRLDPDYDNVYYNRGNAYLAKKDYDAAIADFEAALLRNPDNVGARKNLTFARQERGR